MTTNPPPDADAAPPIPPAGPPKPQPQSVPLEVPPDLEAVYSNFVLITHSPSEVLLDYARVLPNMRARVLARIVLTPLNAKLLLRALADNLAKYEAQFGEIAVPTQLADQLFKPPKTE